MQQSHSSDRSSSILVAANRLPVSAFHEQDRWKFVESPGGLVSALKGVDLDMEWIGWAGNDVPENSRHEFRSDLTQVENRFALSPVFISPEDENNYYHGLSNQLIWPSFHDLPHLTHFSKEHWQAYARVNRLFAVEILHAIKRRHEEQPHKEILVWIHDYQLMMVPALLRAMLVKNSYFRSIRVKIGFFLHIPFPEFDQFVHVPQFIRRELVAGLLSSDLVGFHERSYLINFVECVRKHFTLARIDGLHRIQYQKHTTDLSVYPIGIDPSQFENALRRLNPHSKVPGILEKYANTRLLLGVDRVDPSKGLIEKLDAFAEFLDRHPEHRGKVSLLQVAVPSRTKIKEYSDLKDALSVRAEQINQKYQIEGAAPPVEVLFHNFGISDLCRLYRAAEVLLVTSLRDGMNLVSFEYSVCQSSEILSGIPHVPGSLILSKNVGAAKYLDGTIQINPQDPVQVADAIVSALTLSIDERRSRIETNLDFIKKQTSTAWANHFIRDLESVRASHPIH